MTTQRRQGIFVSSIFSRQSALRLFKPSISLAATMVIAFPVEAHTISVGYVNAGFGLLDFWYGTYHSPSEANYTEGQLRLQSTANAYDQTSTFTLLTTIKPNGLIDGTNNFYSNSSQTALVNTGFRTVDVWEGANFTVSQPGTYTFTYIPIANPTDTWNPYAPVLTNMVTITAADLGYPISLGQSFDQNYANSAPQNILFTGGTLAPTADFSTSKPVSLTSQGGRVDTTSGNVVFSGIVSGPGALTKTGSGILQLAGDNTYTGGTTVIAGTLQIGGGGTTGSVVGDIVNDSIVSFNRSDVTTYNNVISGSGALRQDGRGTLILAGNNTYAGGTTIAAGTLQIGNGGTSGAIVGDTLNNGNLTFDRSDTFTYGGAISGSGLLVKSGGGTLTLSGASSYTGGTSVTAGTLALGNASAIGSGALSLNEGTTLAFTNDMTLTNPIDFPEAGDPIIDTGANSVTIASAITGIGDLSKIGTGMLTLSGQNSYTGATDVVAGTLVVSGSIAPSSGVTVENGAVLGGSGTVPGVTALSGSTVAPGVATPFSTLNVAGNVSFATGSTYQVQINAAGQTDAIVASGTASLSGGTVSVLAGSGSYAASTTYRILSAAGGRTGQFGSLTTTTNLAFLSPYLSYDPTGVSLAFTRATTGGTVVQFPSTADTQHQLASAAAIESLGAGSLYAAVLSQTAAGARAAFDAASGEIHASALTAGIEDTRLVREAIFGRLADAARSDSAATPATTASPYTVWGTGFGDFGHNGGNGNAATLDRSLGGFVLGADAAVQARAFSAWRIGVAGGYTNDALTVKGRGSNGSFESYFGGLYAGAAYGAFDVKLGVQAGGTQTNTRRSVSFPGFSDTVHASNGGSVVQGFGEFGYKIALTQGFVEPLIQGAAIHLDQDGYRETGEAAALRGFAHATDVETTTLGLRGEAALPTAWPLFARGFLGWRHAYGDVDPKALVAFTGGGPVFSVSGAPIARDAVVTEAGLDYRASQTVTLGLSYTGQAGRRANDNGVKGLLEVRF